MDGTVLEIHADVGEAVGNAPVITLADLETPLLEVFLDETDMDKVEPGFEAEVIFDAIPDTTYSGHVTEVDPALSTSPVWRRCGRLSNWMISPSRRLSPWD